MIPKRPTLDDVALLASVSGKTVARVVNGEAGVSAKTRERVMQAVRQLEYRPNLSARSLASARSFRLGVISPYLSAYYVSQLHQGATQACHERGYQLVIEHLDMSESGALDRFERRLRQQPLDGVLLAAPLGDEAALLDLLDKNSVRYVRHAPCTDPDRSDAVFADDGAATKALAEHLWSLGHRRFGITRGPDGHLSTNLRHDSFVDTVAELSGGHDCVHAVQLELIGTALLIGMQAAEQLLARTPKPTVIVAFNDDVAAGILAFAHQAGIAMPGELAVTGFDNTEFSIMTWPQLTTVQNPIAAMAVVAVDWLTTPSPTSRQILLPAQVIIRGSTDPESTLKTNLFAKT